MKLGVPKFRAGEVLPPLHFVPSPNYSDRYSAVDLIVIHDEEGGYQGSISWFQNRASQVSAHLTLREDGLDATQMVPFSKKAWHAADFNSRSIGLEMAGFASKGYSPEELRRAARIVAKVAKDNKIPVRLSGPDGKGRVPAGITFHQLLGVAGGGHHDPGFSPLEMSAFVALVQAETKRGRFRRFYGRK